MRFNITMLVIMLILSTGCKKFLDKTPSEGGLEGFKDASQFDALLNEIRITRNRYEWNHAILASDDCYYHPDFQTANPGTYQQREAFNVWNENELKGLTGTSNGFMGPWSYMYTLNFITDNIEKPTIDGSSQLKKQVKGEAEFFRALYYFTMMVQYTMHPGLNNGQYPGLGYRNTTSTDPSTYNNRETVKYSMNGIIADLEDAEKLLTEAGKNNFNISQPWRATTVAVQALSARVHLYMGNYDKAFQYAKKAYTAYNFLYDLNDASLFTMQNRGSLQTETYNGVTYSVYAQSPTIAADQNTSDAASNSNYYYKESYFRFVSQISALNKMPPSQELYNMYSSDDLRKKLYYDNNININAASLFPPRRMNELVSKSYMKNGTSITGSGYVLGVTVPEIMLIMAECRARGVGDGDNAQTILRNLRKKRFPTGYVDNIGGTLKDVKDERRRELAFVMRWYDLKRYNALDKDDISIKKLARRDVYQINSDLITYTLTPNAGVYALPIPQVEVDLLGWQQNEYSGVVKQ